MKTTTTVFAALALALAAALPSAFAQTVDPGVSVAKNDKIDLNITGRAQMLGVLENVPDPYRDHNRLYLFMKQARIGFKGAYESLYKFETQFAFGGESANGSNTDLSLLDFFANVSLKELGHDNASVMIGQFRVPFGRENMTDTGYMDYTARSINSLGSGQGRDYGLAIVGTKDAWTGTLGTFSSGGRDVPQRFLPERLGVPYVATRFGYNDGYDEDLYHVQGVPMEVKRTVKAVMFNGIYMQDTLIGHSSALQTRQIEKNPLIDGSFNPYIGAGPNNAAGASNTMHRGHLFWLGGDAGIRRPLGENKSVGAEAELNWGGYQNRYGVLHMTTGRVQTDYRSGRFDIGLRYGLMKFDKNSGFLSTAKAAGATTPQVQGPVVNNELGTEIHEITPSMSWHFRGHNMKVVGDLPIFLNCPLWYEDIGRGTAANPSPVGAYAFVDPSGTNQNSVLANVGNHTQRRTVVEARMLFQFMF